MSRIKRRTATITLVIDAKSDENPFRSGYIGGQSSAQLETTLRAWANEWFEAQFPMEKKKSLLEFVSVAISIS